jgi:hypothetical protein
MRLRPSHLTAWEKWRLRPGTRTRAVLQVLMLFPMAKGRSVDRLWLDDRLLVRGAHRAVRWLDRHQLVTVTRIAGPTRSSLFVGCNIHTSRAAKELGF